MNENTPHLFVDNQAAINVVDNPKAMQCTKHQAHTCSSEVYKRTLGRQNTSTEIYPHKRPAGRHLYYKALPRPQFTYLRDKLLSEAPSEYLERLRNGNNTEHVRFDLPETNSA